MKFRISLYLLISVFMTGTYGQEIISPPHVAHPVYFDVSPPLKDRLMNDNGSDKSWKDGVVPNFFMPRQKSGQNVRDESLQLADGLLQSDTTIQNFNGISAGNSVPPDTYGEAGPDCFFQVVNTSFAIYNKSGAKIYGPFSNSSVWEGMPHNTNSGDAVVLWDENAQRWLFTQFSLPNYPAGPFYQMIAISQTTDPTGSWYRYVYEFQDMPDYPKFGVWPDGYYMSANRFNTSGWQGNGAYGYDRSAMLAGNPDAQRISFEMSVGYVTQYPADCDGAFPPSGTPAYFAYIKNNSPQSLGVYEFHADFANPSASTYGNLVSLPVTPFNNLQNEIPQKGTSIRLESLDDRLMYRLQYRVFNGYSAMVVNHTVSAGSDRAGVRWYELRKSSGAWSIYQQSTYAPSDNNSRWMGSVAMDTAGTIALGYSVSGPDLYPGIRYTGRFKNDPLNQMTIAERTIINGGGCQTGSWSGRSRWGDYSAMSVDPSNPTTFWFTTEYYPATASMAWVTRIGSFTFQNVFSSTASATPSFLCLGDSSKLEAVAYGGTGNYTYSWSSIPAGYSSTQRTGMVSPEDTTVYIVATSDGTKTRTDTVTIKVVPHAIVEAGEDTTVCSWVTSFPVSGFIDHARNPRWGTYGDGHFIYPLALNTSYVPGPEDKSNGSVNILLMAYSLAPCVGKITDLKHITIDACTGIETQGHETTQMKITPNPAERSTTFTILGLNEKAILSITGMDGTTYASFPVESSGQSISKQLDLSAFAPGIYLVRLKGSGEILTGKLVIR